jgi:hypothetical protein
VIAPPHRIPIVNGSPLFLGFNASADHPFPPSCSDGDLLDQGYEELQKLGEAYRGYLIDQTQLLPPKYNPWLVSVRSSYVKRAIESVIGFVNGLYPPVEDGERLDVRTTGVKGADPLVPGEAEAEGLMGNRGKGFLGIGGFEKRFLESKEILKPVLDFFNMGDIHPYGLLTLGDFFRACRCAGHNVSEMVKEEAWNRMMSDLDFVLKEFYTLGATEFFGAIWKLIDTGINEFYEQKSRTRFTVLAGHDVTLLTILAGIGRKDLLFALPYASHLSVEIWHLGRPLVRFVLNGQIVAVDGHELFPLSEFRKRFE